MLRACLAGVLLCCASASVVAAATAPVPEAATTALPRDRVVAQVTTLAHADQQYSLYLPADYTPQRRWPLLIVLDARGRGEDTLRLALEGARSNGWIVMSSHQSRSDTAESVTLQALQALLDEAAQRYAYDRRRLYLAGFSGTAKTLWTVVAPLRGQLAGMIGCGGGRPPELGPLRLPQPAFFGMAGSGDFNYQEMRELDAELAQAGAVHRLAIFDGGHEWPADPAVFAAAIDWLELMAMRAGTAPRREAWIDAQLARARIAVAAVPDALQRWRRSEQLARDFDGLRDVQAERDAAARLADSAEVRAGLSVEHRLRAAERRHAQRFDEWRARAGQRFVEGRRQDPPSAARALSELRIGRLREQAAADDPAVAASARRSLERDYVATAFYLPEQLVAQGDLPRAAAMLAIASAIFPERPQPHWRRAQVLALDGDADGAFAALRACAQLGYGDPASLRSDPAWQHLRDDPRWAGTLAAIEAATADQRPPP